MIKPEGWMHAYRPPNSPQKFWRFRNTQAPWKDGTGEVVAVYAIPDTHQIMPVKLTEKMIAAALPELMREDDEDKYRALGQLICVWDALIDAAKEPQCQN